MYLRQAGGALYHRIRTIGWLAWGQGLGRCVVVPEGLEVVASMRGLVAVQISFGSIHRRLFRASVGNSWALQSLGGPAQLHFLSCNGCGLFVRAGSAPKTESRTVVILHRVVSMGKKAEVPHSGFSMLSRSTSY